MNGRISEKLIWAVVVLSASAVFISDSSSWAMRGRGANGRCGTDMVQLAAEKAPYGISEGGDYGEQKRVTSRAQAKKILDDYFAGKNLKVGRITEKGLYFEAEIRDAGGKLVDVVIVDKRTGRIRSTY